MVTEGLRERKKRETRRRIADVATMLFAVRGFDNVTIAEVAEAADVSKKTVTNYFHRKEDLFLDRQEDRLRELEAVVLQRPEGQSAVTALRHYHHELLATGHPLSGVVENIRPFFQILNASPALVSRAREMDREIAQTLTAALVTDGLEPLRARLAGAQLAAAISTIFDIASSRLMAGEDVALVRAEQAGIIDAGFDLVERGLGDLA